MHERFLLFTPRLDTEAHGDLSDIDATSTRIFSDQAQVRRLGWAIALLVALCEIERHP